MRAAQARPPPSAGRKEGQEGRGPATRQFESPSAVALASLSSVLKVHDWSCVGTRGNDSPTSGQVSDTLLHVNVGRGPRDILQRVELSSVLPGHVGVFAEREPWHGRPGP